jgi:tetratricopeptide (TPR) repeat protein
MKLTGLKFRTRRPVAAFAGTAVLAASIATQIAAQPVVVPATTANTLQRDESLARILDLGNADFRVRQMAAQRLDALNGADTDRLLLATRSSDAEIARTARSLLTAATLDRAMIQAAPETADYVMGDSIQRRRTLEQLCRMAAPRSTACLAAVACYESNEALSAIAAAELITGQHDGRVVREVIRDNPRRGPRWLRIWFTEDADTASFVTSWQGEMELLLPARSDGVPSSPAEYRMRLAQATVARYCDGGANDEARELLRRLGDAAARDPVRLAELCDWLAARNQPAWALEILQQHAEPVDQDAGLLCRRAASFAQLGNETESEAAFARAVELVGRDLPRCIEVAEQLRICGHGAWSCRLLEKGLEQSGAVPSRISGSRLLAQWQFANGNPAEAAALLEQVITETGARASAAPEEADEATLSLQAECALYRFHACLLEDDRTGARRALLDGLLADSCNGRLLIAAAEFDPDDKTWSTSIDELVGLALDIRQRRIEALGVHVAADPAAETLQRYELARECNAFAWLASGTSRQLEQAEACARQALELEPENCCVLDTLAACLFAQGRYNEAIAVQERAVQRAPWDEGLQVGLMRYQQARNTAGVEGIIR